MQNPTGPASPLVFSSQLSSIGEQHEACLLTESKALKSKAVFSILTSFTKKEVILQNTRFQKINPYSTHNIILQTQCYYKSEDREKRLPITPQPFETHKFQRKYYIQS